MITPYDILVDMLAVKSGKFTIANLKARLLSNSLMVAVLLSGSIVIVRSRTSAVRWP